MSPEPSEADLQTRRRYSLLQELSNVLAQSQPALLGRHLQEIHANTARLKAVFNALKALNEETHSSKAQPAIERAEAGRRHELKALEKQIRNAALQYAALIRRARRTSDLFALALTNSALTYSPPQQEGR